jgi:hypothetical protein
MSDTNVHRVVGNLLVGTSHFFVDTTTNQVGINTSSPSAALDVATGDVKVGSGITLASSTGTITATGGFSGNGSGLTGVNSDSGSWVKDDTNGLIYVANSAHKVGIGTTDPVTPFELVVGTSAAPLTAETTVMQLNSTLDGSSSDHKCYFKFQYVPESNPVDWTDWSGRIQFVTDATNQGYIEFNPPGAEYAIAFGNTGGGSAAGEIMRLLGTGNVGIGTTEPETIFQIGSKAAATGVNYLKIRGNNTSTFSDICGIIFNNSSSASLDGLRGESKIINERAVNNYGSALAFYTNPADNPGGANPPGVNSVKRMVIDNDGNVGIPTTSEFKLDVGGSLTSGRSLAVRSGDTNAGTDSIQILFGYGNLLDYAHSIRTRHNSAGYDNAIDFWCWDTSTTASTYGNKRVMSVEAKEIGGSREGLVTVHGVMIATSQPRWCWYGSSGSGWSNSGYLTYTANMVTQTRMGGTAGGGYAVAQVAGVYYVSWCAFSESSTTGSMQYEIRKNNGGFIRNYHVQPIANYSATGGLSCLIPLNVGDHVRVYINKAVHHNANSCFSGFLVA